MLLIIAINEHHYVHWCHSHEIPINKRAVKYISKPEQLYGYIGHQDMDIITLPEWYLHKSGEDINKFDILIKEHWKRKLKENNNEKCNKNY